MTIKVTFLQTTTTILIFFLSFLVDVIIRTIFKKEGVGNDSDYKVLVFNTTDFNQLNLIG